MNRSILIILFAFVAQGMFAAQNLLVDSDQKVNEMIEHVKKSIENASNNKSQLIPEIYEIDGMSSRKVRDLLNNLCTMPNTYYLEIGCWKGSTLISALFGNENSVVEAIAIDDWSQFGAPIKVFNKNVNRFLKDNNLRFYSEDSFSINLNSIFNHSVNVYFYDGDHSTIAQERALTYFDPILDDVFILVVDDWNWKEVKGGTKSGITKLNYEVVFFSELPANHNGDKANWWNGLYVAVIRKQR